MAISNTNKTLFLPVLAFISLFLMLMNGVNSSSSLSFSFDSFVLGQRNLIFQGDARIAYRNYGIDLTARDRGHRPVPFSVGRALYSTPVQLWDSRTGNVASFETTFTFGLTSLQNYPAHGLAFFIAPPSTTIPFNSTRGFLGLFTPEKAFDASANRIVAVEFDTYPDPEWDPNYRHIGIDVNTINSTAFVGWERREGEIATARITYDSGTRTLTVTSNYPNSRNYAVSQIVDLKAILPEWVRIGFSASTGNYVQTHTILSWSFSSFLQSSRAEEDEKEEEKQYIARYV